MVPTAYPRKEKYQHADSSFPYNDEQAKRLAIKLDKFLLERLYSTITQGLLDMYSTPEKSIAKVRHMALVKIFLFGSQFLVFAESIDHTNLSYEELVTKAKSHTNEKPNFDQPFISVICSDEDNFQESVMDAMKKSLNQMKIVDARKVNFNEKTIVGLANIKVIIENTREMDQDNSETNSQKNLTGQ